MLLIEQTLLKLTKKPRTWSLSENCYIQARLLTLIVAQSDSTFDFNHQYIFMLYFFSSTVGYGNLTDIL